MQTSADLRAKALAAFAEIPKTFATEFVGSVYLRSANILDALHAQPELWPAVQKLYPRECGEMSLASALNDPSTLDRHTPRGIDYVDRAVQFGLLPRSVWGPEFVRP